jgi:hypothetical protein
MILLSGVNKVMRVKQFSTACSTVCTAIALVAGTTAANADNNDGSHIWMPKQSNNQYWQAPEWSKPSQNAPTYNRAQQQPVNQQQVNQRQVYQQQAPQRPASPQPYTGNYRGQSPAPYGGYNRPPQASKPAPGANRSSSMPPPPTGPYSGSANRSAPAGNAAPRTPYRSAPYSSAPNRSAAYGSTPYRSTPYRSSPYRGAPYRGYRDSGASAFNTPGYNRYRYGKKNDRFWSDRKPWGDSGPSKWFNPSKDNWEESWEDMINAPSNMGEMPGGWYAPYVSMPNPIDMGDQFQDNIKDLPEQIRDMDVGNEVVDED